MNPSALLRRTFLVVALTASSGATLVLTAGAGSADSGRADGKGRTLTTTLSGAQEVPAADSKGSGSASLTLNAGRQQVCYDLTWQGIGEVKAAHVHQADAGVNGPVFFGLPLSGTPGKATGCLTIAREKLVGILGDASNYYVNFHTEAFPGGAVRGQLAP